MPLIVAQHISKHFPIYGGLLRKTIGVVKALTDVSFTIEKGQILGVVGETGSGKSTLAKTVLYLLKPSAGVILFDGLDMRAQSLEALALLRRRMQIVFQNPAQSLNPRKTISDILREPLEFHRIVKQEKLFHHIECLLDRVGLVKEVALRYPHELSIGQQQRVAIARALSVQPDFMVLDECVSALDISVQAQILNLLLDLQAEYHMTYLFISHDLAVVEHVADVILVMKDGTVVESGDATAVFDHPKHIYTQQLLHAMLPNL